MQADKEVAVSKRSFVSLLHRSFIVVALIAAASLPVSAQEPPRQPPPAGAFAPGQILVKFKPGAGGLSAQRALAAQSLTVAGDIPSLGVLKVSVEPGRELEKVAALRSDPNVLYAEPNYIAHAVDTIPNDPYYYWSQWGLSKINAPAAWDYTTGAGSVVIAVVDTGVDLTHPDLSCPGKLLAGWNFIGDNNNPDDDNGHGTHVAGIAAACSNNGRGVTGVAWGARLLPVKVLASDGYGSYATVAAGITYAVDRGANIVNLSLGGHDDSITLADAVRYANDRNRLVVAASGNTNGAVLYPAAYPEALAVAATDNLDERYWNSNFGPELDLSAPGVDVYSTYPWNVDNSSHPWCYGHAYCLLTGTSMATPHVSGLAALLWSSDRDLTNDRIRDAIQATADDLGTPGRDDYFGHGRINAARALESISLRTSPAQILFLVDDHNGPFPPSNRIRVTTTSPNAITWTAGISPDVAWLSVTPPVSGAVSSASAGGFTLEMPTRPYTYGTYIATLVVTGTALSGAAVGPATSEVRVSYLPQLYLYLFPRVYKN